MLVYQSIEDMHGRFILVHVHLYGKGAKLLSCGHRVLDRGTY